MLLVSTILAKTQRKMICAHRLTKAVLTTKACSTTAFDCLPKKPFLGWTTLNIWQRDTKDEKPKKNKNIIDPIFPYFFIRLSFPVAPQHNIETGYAHNTTFFFSISTLPCIRSQSSNIIFSCFQWS